MPYSPVLLTFHTSLAALVPPYSAQCYAVRWQSGGKILTGAARRIAIPVCLSGRVKTRQRSFLGQAGATSGSRAALAPTCRVAGRPTISAPLCGYRRARDQQLPPNGP